MINNDIQYDIQCEGIQTISEDGITIISESLIAFGLSGYLMLFNLNSCKVVDKIFLDASMIKCIFTKKVPNNNTIICVCENAKVFQIDVQTKSKKYLTTIKCINNVYSFDLSDDNQYAVLNSHVIRNCQNNEIIEQNDAITIVKFKDNDFKVEMNTSAKNAFSMWNCKKENEIISFIRASENKSTYLTIHSKKVNHNEWNSITLPITIPSDVNRVKKYKDSFFIAQCYNRTMYFLDISLYEIRLIIEFEGKGILGQFAVYNNEIIIANKPQQLISINPNELMNTKENKQIIIAQKEVNPIIINDQITGLNWATICLSKNKVIVANENGLLYFLNSSLHCIQKNPLSLSGCGTVITSLSPLQIFYGDLNGNIIKHTPPSYKSILLSNSGEMIRCISLYLSNIYCGTMSGNIYRFLSQNDTFENILTLPSEATVTCMRTNKQFLFASDINGYLHIYDIDNKHNLVYEFQAHKPNELNNNINFGSLHLKSEIWSFAKYDNTLLFQNKTSALCFIATASEDQSIKIFEISKSKSHYLIHEKHDNSLAVTCLDWNTISNKKEILASCSDDGTLHIYDVQNNFALLSLLNLNKYIFGFFTLTYLSLNKSGNDSRIVITTQVGYMIIYDIIDNKILFIEKIHYGGIEGLDFNDNLIASCGNDCVLTYMLIDKK